MNYVRNVGSGDPIPQDGSVEVMSRDKVVRCTRWPIAFAHERKDHRYYEIVEDTIQPAFSFSYFVVRDESGEVVAIQPFFVMNQDLLEGMKPRIGAAARFIRRLWPQFMKMRTLMVGCAAGEGHLDGQDLTKSVYARVLARQLVPQARKLKIGLIVFKEFPAKYRSALQCFLEEGYTRVPSLPMTCLDINYADFQDYMDRALNSATRRKLRKKFAIAAQAPPIEMSVMNDVTPFIDDVYPLYLQVYERSKLHFEKLTKAYFCSLGRRMPDKVRFFLWRQRGKVVAFSMCMLQDDAFYAEYVGFDYAVALALHLYHYVVRDMVSWAIANNCRSFRSSALNYDPKLHLRHVLDPLDLYVRHTSGIINYALKWALPWLEPTRYDETLRKFPNFQDLWQRP
jgi:predicted N-acyltransferase